MKTHSESVKSIQIYSNLSNQLANALLESSNKWRQGAQAPQAVHSAVEMDEEDVLTLWPTATATAQRA